MIAYAVITNTMLMTIYSMNNMPYAALGGVMTGDLDERSKLKLVSFYIAVNVAQFHRGRFSRLPLVARFAQGHDLAYGWPHDDDDLGRGLFGFVLHHLRDHSRSALCRWWRPGPRQNRILKTC